jgi:hypothetical protein
MRYGLIRKQSSVLLCYRSKIEALCNSRSTQHSNHFDDKCQLMLAHFGQDQATHSSHFPTRKLQYKIQLASASEAVAVV